MEVTMIADICDFSNCFWKVLMASLKNVLACVPYALL